MRSYVNRLFLPVTLAFELLDPMWCLIVNFSTFGNFANCHLDLLTFLLMPLQLENFLSMSFRPSDISTFGFLDPFYSSVLCLFDFGLFVLYHFDFWVIFILCHYNFCLFTFKVNFSFAIFCFMSFRPGDFRTCVILTFGHFGPMLIRLWTFCLIPFWHLDFSILCNFDFSTLWTLFWPFFYFLILHVC